MREMANTESTDSQAQNQLCAFHRREGGDLTHLPLSHPANTTETILIAHYAVLTYAGVHYKCSSVN